MAKATDDSHDIEKLYEYGELLNEAKDKSQNQKDYEGIIAAANGSVKAKQLAAQMIPKFFKYFPKLSEQALDQHLYLCEDEELGVRVQAIRGLPLFCKDTPEHLAKIVDILGQLLIAGDNVERDAVHKALMSLLRQDVKTSLTALFKHIGSTDDRNAEDLSAWEGIREKVLCFIRDKVFHLKAELLKPKDEMERGASSSKFFNYLTKQIIPVFEKLPEERKLDLLKNLAECSLYAKPQDSRQLLPSVVQLLKKYMVRRKIEEINFTSIECLLYAFHHLANKTPNATNSLCGYKIVTGQPSDRLGEDFSEQYKDFTERLSTIEELSKAMNKKLTQGMAEHNKAMAAAKTDEEKETIKLQKHKATAGLRSCNNILSMAQPLHSKAPSFIGDQKINLSWKEVTKLATSSGAAATTGQKRTANGSGSNVTKKGRGASSIQNQLVNGAFEGLNDARSGGRGGRGWRGRGGGRGYHRY